MNRRAEEALGHEAGSLLGRRVSVPSPEPLDEELLAACQRAVREQALQALEHFSSPLDRWFESRIHPSAGGLVVLFHDITERRRAERAVRDREELMASLLATSPTIIFRGDLRTHTTEYVGPNLRVLLGYAPEEGGGVPGWWPDHLHPDDRERVLQALQAAARSASGDLRFEFRLLHREGHYRWFLCSVQFEHDADGEPLRMTGHSLDITERKELEAALSESEQRLRQIAETSPNVFWICTKDLSRFLYVSPAFERIWGRSSESLYSDAASFLEAVHPDDREMLLSLLQACMEGRTVEYRIIRPDGSVRWVSSHGAPVRDGTGGIVRIAGTTEDVTERKRWEGALAAAERRYRRLLDTSPYPIYALDVEGRFTEANRSGLDLIRREASEVLGHSFAEVVAPEDRARVAESIRRKVEDGEDVTEIECEIVRPSGERRLLSIRATSTLRRAEHSRGSALREGDGSTPASR